MFKEPFELMSPLKMHKECSKCGQSFEPEPMFYFGAMYISYMLSTVILLPLALIVVFAFDWSVGKMLALIIGLGVLFYFKVLRISRSIWIHIVVKYNPPVN